MKEEEIKKFISFTAIISVLIWIAIIFYLSIEPISLDSLQHLSTVISTITILWVFYFRWGWKCAPFKLLFPKPNLNGTWIGYYQSDGVNEKGERVPNGEIMLTIRQNFLFTHLTSYTERHIAYSYAENLLLDTNRGIQKLIYLYSQDRIDPGAEGARQGTAELTIFGEPVHELSGDFWTNAKSYGFLKLRRVSHKHMTSFREAKKNWPKKQDWGIIKKPR